MVKRSCCSGGNSFSGLSEFENEYERPLQNESNTNRTASFSSKLRLSTPARVKIEERVAVRRAENPLHLAV